MFELFIEGQFIDVNPTFSTLLTLAIDDIKDFGAKNTTFSKTIVVPGTKRNNINLGNIYRPTGSNSYDPAQPNIGANFNAAMGATAYIFSGNMQIFKGIARLMEVIDDDGFIEYELVVFGELGGFVAKLGNKKLEDLDFAAYNMTYSLANIVASWDNTPGSGVYFPLIDYGTYSTGKHDWSYRTFRPALYAKEYIDKIFAAAGYTYDCAEFNTARFKTLVHPYNRKALTRVSATAFDVSPYIGSSTPLANPIYYPFPTQTTLGSFTSNVANNRFTYGGGTALTGTLQLTLNGTYSKDMYAGSMRITVYKNYGIAGQATIGQYTFGANTFNGSYACNITAPGTTFSSGDYLEVHVTGPKTPMLGYTFTVASGQMTITSSSALDVQINLGEPLVVNNTLPRNVLQTEYLSSILKLFNMYVFADYDNEYNLKIQPFIDFYYLAPTVDWSNKVDRSKPLKYKPMGELNSRFYEFNFKEDGDFYNDLYKKRYNKNYGSYIYDSEYEFVNESTTVELIFSGTPIVGYSGEDKAYSTILKQTGSGTIVEENVDSNIRILQTKKITGVSSWDIKNGATVLGSYTVYGYAGHFDDPDAPADDIQFGVPEELFYTLATGALNVNQFNVYWSTYMAEITDKDSRLLKCTLHLYSKDIYRLNFATLIYIDGCLYRINKIADFNATNEDTCEGEFLKVINRIY